jgi:hypothetical protein
MQFQLQATNFCPLRSLTTRPSNQWVTGDCEKVGPGVKLEMCLHLVWRIRISAAIHPLPYIRLRLQGVQRRKVIFTILFIFNYM